MDIHAPHEPVHSWRDFFIHLTIVTIGLFIALSLEAFVEYIHHRHIVAEARENIHQEVEDNHKAMQQDLGYIATALQAQHANIETIHRFEDPHASTDHYHLDYAISFNQPDDAAWNSARDTGALTFMPYKQVQEYSGLYATQALVNGHMIEIIHREELALAPVYMYSKLKDMSADAKRTMLQNSAELLVEIDSLQQIIQELDQQYVDELKK
jgi:hypothetical protein